MTERISINAAIASFPELLERVRTSGDEFIVEEGGRIIARIGPGHAASDARREPPEQVFQQLEDASAAGLSDEEVMEAAREAKQWARQRAAVNQK